MAFPVRCNTCGKTIGHLWENYLNEISKDENGNELTVKDNVFLTEDQLDKETITEKAFKTIGIKKYCCKRMMLSSIDTTDLCG
jgi:DNA-directed RNA polymerase subunit N (RpoN/RPB10)